MRGHTRPHSVNRIIAANRAAEMALVREDHEFKVRASVTAILAERGYRPLAIEPGPRDMWSVAFAPTAGSDGERYEVDARARDLLYVLSAYPHHIPGGPLVNRARIALAIVNRGRRGVAALADFTRPTA